jgi:hypothetical protein
VCYNIITKNKGECFMYYLDLEILGDRWEMEQAVLAELAEEGN